MFDAELSISKEMRKITASSAYNNTSDPCLKNRGGTHQARLVRTVDYAFAEIGATQDFAGVVQSLELGMCEDGLFGRFPASISNDDLALEGNNGADWQLTCLFGVARFLDG